MKPVARPSFLQIAPARWPHGTGLANRLPIAAAPLNDRAASDALDRLAKRRGRIWDLASSLHCSIIGTCLTAGELRAIVRKFKAVSNDTLSDHAVHAMAVSIVERRDVLAKQIQKALDRRHNVAIARAASLDDASALQEYWNDSVRAGDIPGPYWAVLTHPSVTDALIRRAFGDVHMLSHMIGASNRADLRRLNQLETENAALQGDFARQQAQMRESIVTRDEKIYDLNALLSARIGSDAATADAPLEASAELTTLNRLVADLRKQLDVTTYRLERTETRLATATGALQEKDRLLAMASRERADLRDELSAAEDRVAASSDSVPAEQDRLALAQMTILYVGGQPSQVARLKAIVAQAAGTLLHHDGGIEENIDLLPGLVSRADLAFFPVDCISHTAAQGLKRLCRQAGKRFIPLRSAGIGSMLLALRDVAVSPPATLADADD